MALPNDINQREMEKFKDVSGTTCINISLTEGTISIPAGASTAANQVTIIGHIDGIETLLTTIDADTGGIATSASSIDGKITACNTGAVVLATGTASIGKLAANSGVDIGDVDVLSIAAGDNNIGNVDIVTLPSGNLGQQAMAASLSAVPASDITDATYIGDIKFGESLPAGDALIGRSKISDGTTVAAVDATTTALKVYLATALDDAIDSVTSKHAFAEQDLATEATTHVKKYYTSAGAVTDGIIWSPAAGKRWYLTDICINVSAAATVTLEDDLAAGDAAVWKAELAANSGWSHSFTTPLFSGEDAADLIITTTAGNIYVSAVGYEI